MTDRFMLIPGDGTKQASSHHKAQPDGRRKVLLTPQIFTAAHATPATELTIEILLPVIARPIAALALDRSSRGFRSAYRTLFTNRTLKDDLHGEADFVLKKATVVVCSGSFKKESWCRVPVARLSFRP